MDQAGSTDRWVRMPIGLQPELYEWLRVEAFNRRVAMAEIVREALATYRERIDPQLTLPIDR